MTGGAGRWGTNAGTGLSWFVFLAAAGILMTPAFGTCFGVPGSGGRIGGDFGLCGGFFGIPSELISPIPPEIDIVIIHLPPFQTRYSSQNLLIGEDVQSCTVFVVHNAISRSTCASQFSVFNLKKNSMPLMQIDFFCTATSAD